MPFSWAFVRPALLASGHKKTTELVDSPWFVLIKPTFVRLGCGKTGTRNRILDYFGMLYNVPFPQDLSFSNLTPCNGDYCLLSSFSGNSSGTSPKTLLKRRMFTAFDSSTIFI